jgi:hypothetical protein
LDDAEEPLAVRGRLGLATPTRPRNGPLDGLLHDARGSGQGGALVQGHDDVCAELVLNMDGILRVEPKAGSIDVRFEGDAIIVYVG